MDKKAVVIDVVVPNDSKVSKKEHGKLEKYQSLREQLEKMWGVKIAVVAVVIGALGLWSGSNRSQEQKLRSVRKSKGLGEAKILHRTFMLPVSGGGD